MKGKGLFDLEKHYAFYVAYHRNPMNMLVHMVFVWPSFFTALVPLYFTPSLCQLLGMEPQCFLASRGLFLNLGFFVALVYAGFFMLMDRKAGFVAGFLCMACWAGSSHLARHLGLSLAWKVVLAAQILCWTGQFLGHGIFEKRAPALLDNLNQAFLMAPSFILLEKRAPALLDNLIQAFLMAPFFVLLKILQDVFGYEPYPGFHLSVKQKVDAEIKAGQETKQKKVS